MVYPNAAKDTETSNYPYVELFRDFAAAVCRPNSTLVTYGYSFGDDHINRVIKDMLPIPSTHLMILFSESARLMTILVDLRKSVCWLAEHWAILANLRITIYPNPLSIRRLSV